MVPEGMPADMLIYNQSRSFQVRPRAVAPPVCVVVALLYLGFAPRERSVPHEGSLPAGSPSLASVLCLAACVPELHIDSLRVPQTAQAVVWLAAFRNSTSCIHSCSLKHPAWPSRQLSIALVGSGTPSSSGTLAPWHQRATARSPPFKDRASVAAPPRAPQQPSLVPAPRLLAADVGSGERCRGHPRCPQAEPADPAAGLPWAGALPVGVRARSLVAWMHPYGEACCLGLSWSMQRPRHVPGAAESAVALALGRQASVPRGVACSPALPAILCRRRTSMRTLTRRRKSWWSLATPCCPRSPGEGLLPPWAACCCAAVMRPTLALRACTARGLRAGLNGSNSLQLDAQGSWREGGQ